MKYKINILGGIAILGAMLFTVNLANAQTSGSSSTTTTTTTDGTVSQFGPDTIIVKSTTSTEPLTYSYSKTTVYVDENGKAVASETIKSGAPVTVYYDKDGNKMMATKVVVRKTTTTTTKP